MTRWAIRDVLPAGVLLGAAIGSGCAHQEPAGQCSNHSITGDIDKRSDVGITASELLQAIAGTRTLVVEWDDSKARTSEDFDVAAELDIARDESRSVRLNVAKPANTTAKEADCPDLLYVPVTVRLKTNDGSFDESGAGEILAAAGMQSSLIFDFSPQQLRGTYDYPKPTEKPVSFHFRLQVNFDDDGQIVRSTLNLLAIWCSQPPCIVRRPGDEPARGRTWSILQLRTSMADPG